MKYPWAMGEAGEFIVCYKDQSVKGQIINTQQRFDLRDVTIGTLNLLKAGEDQITMKLVKMSGRWNVRSVTLVPQNN